MTIIYLHYLIQDMDNKKFFSQYRGEGGWTAEISNAQIYQSKNEIMKEIEKNYDDDFSDKNLTIVEHITIS